MDYLQKGKLILVVDDSEDNLQLIERLLERAGFALRKSLDGQTALSLV